MNEQREAAIRDRLHEAIRAAHTEGGMTRPEIRKAVDTACDEIADERMQEIFSKDKA